MSRRWRAAVLVVGGAWCSGVLAVGTAWAQEPVLAVLGDSLSTGAATNPALAVDAKVLWSVFNGQTSVAPLAAAFPADFQAYGLKDPLPAPVRLWPAAREFFGGPDWVYRNALQILSRAYLDTEEYSWGYMVAAGLGIPAERLLLAGEDGARVVALPRHVDRLLDARAGVLPEKTMIMYTGNDLCGQSMAETTTALDFGIELERGLLYMLRNGQVPAGGADVYLLSNLGILQLLRSESILSKPVRAFGGGMTCRELHAQGFRAKDPNYDPGLPPEAWYFSMFMPPNPLAYCSTLFGGFGPGRDAIVSALANRIRDYRERQARAVRRLNEEAKLADKPVRFHMIDATADVTFVGEDIGEDCFHLSVAGQAKVARAVLSQLKPGG